MRGNPVRLVCVHALLDDEIRRALARTMVVRRFLPRLGAAFQSVHQLAEIEVVQFDAIFIWHISANTPGQVPPVWQELCVLY